MQPNIASGTKAKDITALPPALFYEHDDRPRRLNKLRACGNQLLVCQNRPFMVDDQAVSPVHNYLVAGDRAHRSRAMGALLMERLQLLMPLGVTESCQGTEQADADGRRAITSIATVNPKAR